MILHLGVIDVPEPGGNTTHGVATILEEKYGLFSVFAQVYEKKIVDSLTESMAGSLETLLQGGNVKNPYQDATSEIEAYFKNFLSSQEAEKQGIPGTPTQAALEGRSIRFKGKFNATNYVAGKRAGFTRKVGVRRPSFIDSGVMQASFKSWVD